MVNWSLLMHSLISLINPFQFYETLSWEHSSLYWDRIGFVPLFLLPCLSPFTHIEKFLPIHSLSAWPVTSLWSFFNDFKMAIQFYGTYPWASESILRICLSHLKSIGQTVVLKYSEKSLKEMDILIVKSTGLRFWKLSTKVNKIVYKIMVVSI